MKKINLAVPSHKAAVSTCHVFPFLSGTAELLLTSFSLRSATFAVVLIVATKPLRRKERLQTILTKTDNKRDKSGRRSTRVEERSDREGLENSKPSGNPC